jgi:hypothetical protein
MTSMLTPEENAREDGREAATEWRERSTCSETSAAWRDRCRAKILTDFENGEATAISQAGISREDFMRLLAEWEAAFDSGLCGTEALEPNDPSERDRRNAWQDGYSVGFETARQVLESRSKAAENSQQLDVQRIGREALTLAELLTAASRLSTAPRRVFVATAGLADVIAEELNRIAGGVR